MKISMQLLEMKTDDKSFNRNVAIICVQQQNRKIEYWTKYKNKSGFKLKHFPKLVWWQKYFDSKIKLSTFDSLNIDYKGVCLFFLSMFNIIYIYLLVLSLFILKMFCVLRIVECVSIFQISVCKFLPIRIYTVLCTCVFFVLCSFFLFCVPNFLLLFLVFHCRLSPIEAT